MTQVGKIPGLLLALAAFVGCSEVMVVPDEEPALPAEEGAVPAEEGAVPAEEGAVPAEEAAVPVDVVTESCMAGAIVSLFAPAGMDANALLPAGGDGFIAIGAPNNGGIAELDGAGNVVWSSVPLADGFLHTGAPTGDGGLMVAGQTYDPASPSGKGLWLGRLDGAGTLLASHSLGATHYMAGVDIELLQHPDGGYVLSTHESLMDGEAPQLVLLRLDDEGQLVHRRATPLSPGSEVGYNWSHGAAALLPGGDVVQLTADGAHVRMIRSNGATEPVLDRVLEEIGEVWPQDIAVLPDGRIAVVALSVGHNHVILLDTEGSVLWHRTYRPERDTELSAVAHDPSTGLLHLAGTTRGADGGTQRMWLISVDTDGALRWEHEGAVGTPTGITTVTALPGGGFAAAGFGDFAYAVVRSDACP